MLWRGRTIASMSGEWKNTNSHHISQGTRGNIAQWLQDTAVQPTKPHVAGISDGGRRIMQVGACFIQRQTQVWWGPAAKSWRGQRVTRHGHAAAETATTEGTNDLVRCAVPLRRCVRAAGRVPCRGGRRWPRRTHKPDTDRISPSSLCSSSQLATATTTHKDPIKKGSLALTLVCDLYSTNVSVRSCVLWW